MRSTYQSANVATAGRNCSAVCLMPLLFGRMTDAISRPEEVRR